MVILQTVVSNALVAALLAGLVCGLTSVWRNPFAARALWMLVLVKLVTPPLLTVPLPGIASHEQPATPLRAVTIDTEPIEVDEHSGNTSEVAHPPSESAPQVDSHEFGRARGRIGYGTKRSSDEISAVTVCVAFWLTGTVVLAGLALLRVRRFSRLIRESPSAPSRVHGQLTALAYDLELRVRLDARVTEASVTPVLWSPGFRAVLLLPRALLDAWDTDELRAVLAHELVHLKRGDRWVRWFELVVLLLFWWNPVAWWAVRRMRSAEEECCDATVLRWLGEGAHYGRALFKTAAFLSAPTATMLPASTLGRGHTLKRRLQMILSERPAIPLSSLQRAALALLAVVVLPMCLGAADSPADQPPADEPRATDAGTEQPERAAAVTNGNPATDDLTTSRGWAIYRWIHPAHTQGIESLAFSPDGKTIASAADDKTVKLWDVASGKLALQIERPVNCNDVAYSPDGRLLAIAGGDHGRQPPGEVVLWDLRANKVLHVLQDHRTTLFAESVAFSPDGKWLAAGGLDKVVRLWNAEFGTKVREFVGHRALVSSVAFSPDGKTLASASFDDTVALWDVATGERKSRIKHDADVRVVAFSANGKLLVTGAEDNIARVWDVPSLHRISKMEGHRGWILDAVFAPGDKYVVTAGGDHDKKVMIWEAASGSWDDPMVLPSQTAPIASVTFSPDGRLLAVAGGWNSFQIWRRVRGD